MKPCLQSVFAGAAIAAIGLFGDIAWCGDLGGRVILSYTDTRVDQAENRAFLQNYELRFQRRVTDPLEYHVFLQWVDSRGETTAADGKTLDTRTRLLDPRFEIRWNRMPFQAAAGYELVDVSSTFENGETIRNDTKNQRMYGQFAWRPTEFPNITLRVDRRTDSNEKATLDLADTQVRGTVNYLYRAWNFTYNFWFDDYEDRIGNFRREETQNQGSIRYEDKFLANRLNLSAGYSIDFRQRVVTTDAGVPVRVPQERIPVKGLYANDDTPAGSMDHPMANTPVLIDRNVLVGAGFGIGTPGGIPFQNFGAELGTPVAIEAVYVYVVNGVGGPVSPVGPPVNWSVWVSQDGVLWTAVSTGTPGVFNSGLSRYEIGFAATTSRFVKVVNLNVTATEATVSEIQLFGFLQVAPRGSVKADSTSQAGNVNVSFAPVEAVKLTYAGNFNSYREDASGDRPGFNATSTTNTVSADVKPSRRVRTYLQYGLLQNRSGTGQDSHTENVSGEMDLYLMRNVDIQLTAGRSIDWIGSEKTLENRTVLFHNAARPYRLWTLTLDLGYNQVESFATDLVNTKYSITGTSDAQLYYWLRWLLNLQVLREEVEGLIAVEGRTVTGYSDFTITPNPQLNLGVRWGYVEKTAGDSGFLQRYNLQWYPFPKGNVQFTIQYAMDRDAVSGLRQDGVSGNARWTLNPYAYLSVNYAKAVRRSVVTTTESFSTTTKSFSTTSESLSTTFNITF